MRKFLLIIAMVSLLFMMTACNQSQEPTEEELAQQQIIELALADLGESGEATLEWLFSEVVPWIDYDCVYYKMTVNGKSYLVATQENSDEIHFVDVIEEID